MIRVSELWVHPIKGCGGISVPSLELVSGGPVDDRRFMVVDESGRFLTQREVPRLGQVRLTFGDGGYRLSASKMPPLDFARRPSGGAPRRVSIWNDHVNALGQEELGRWFSTFLERAVDVVYVPEQSLRVVNQRYARASDRVGFADGYPLLLLSQESLDELSRRVGILMDVRRFRPNVVVRGVAEPHAEDHWQSFSIGPLRFRGVKPCDRCVVTTLDPETSQGDKEPLRTLSTYRKSDGKVWFGMNVAHDDPGCLTVGDIVRVDD